MATLKGNLVEAVFDSLTHLFNSLTLFLFSSSLVKYEKKL